MKTFGNLVKNEYIKLFCKSSTIILLILLVVGTAAITLLVRAAAGPSGGSDYREEAFTEHCKDQITWAKNSAVPGWENEVAYYQFALDSGINTFTDWRLNYMDIAFRQSDFDGYSNQKELDTATESLKAGIKANSWKDVLTAMMTRNTLMYGAQNAETAKEENWLFQYCIDNDIEPNMSENWKFREATNLATLKKEVAGIEGTPEGVEYENRIAVLEYRLAHNIEVNTADLEKNGLMSGRFDNPWDYMNLSLQFIQYIGILFIIIAGGIVAEEFGNGTIKFLLINPVKRWKILTAKYVTTVTVGYGFLALAFLVVFLLSGALTGWHGMDAKYLTASDGVISAQNPIGRFISLYLLNSVGVVIMATLAFAISSMVRSSALAIGIGMFALIAGNIINLILVDVAKVDFGRYLIFSNTNLVNVMNGGSGYEGQTLGFSLAVIAVHMVVFLLMAWDGFTRKEI